MELISKCPICGNEEFEEFLEARDNTVSKQNFKIVKCKNCGFRLTNPRPKSIELGDYYKSEEYISHSNTKKGLINTLYQYVRNYTIKRKVSLINSLQIKGKVLDIGCGTGEFLNACKNDGWQTKGIEPDKEARKMGQEKYGLNIGNEEDLDTIKAESFDIITMWHVLEHVPELNKRVGEIKKLLTTDGIAIIAVPNPDSADAKKYGKFWAAWDLPRHLYHFSKNNIIQLFEKHNLKLIKIIPMKFDSYYVSLLSEKYKTGRINFLNGFYNGLISNCKAKKTGYSSQIYIFRKN